MICSFKSFFKQKWIILTDDIQSHLLDQRLVACLAVGQTLIHCTVIIPGHTMVKSWHQFKSFRRSLCFIQMHNHNQLTSSGSVDVGPIQWTGAWSCGSSPEVRVSALLTGHCPASPGSWCSGSGRPGSRPGWAAGGRPGRCTSGWCWSRGGTAPPGRRAGCHDHHRSLEATGALRDTDNN